ncbi:transcriptional repressor protein [mine drainage metagenome]|uniref:Transcriptional repressor protein n=1 Tax=mine drainage metagenome TaxID=410659 RepID=T1CTE5_9ZZZZ
MPRNPARFLRLTSTAFDAAASTIQMSPRTIKLARTVLVEGVPAGPLALQAGVTRQAIESACRRIYAAWIDDQKPPVGWRHVSLFAPPALASAFEKDVAKARIEADMTTRMAAQQIERKMP